MLSEKESGALQGKIFVYNREENHLKEEKEKKKDVTCPCENSLGQNTATESDCLFGLYCNQPDAHIAIYMLK